jgi:hypothetical protein
VSAKRSAIDAEVDDDNRRAHSRLTVSELPWLSKVRLKYGPSVTVLDLSPGGVQIETEGHRLQPGSTVILEISGTGADITAPAEVVRCQMAGLSPLPVYRGGLAFKQPILLPGVPAGDAGEPDPDPLHEMAVLTSAVRQRVNDPALQVGAAELAALRALLEAPAARQEADPFAREVGRLLRLASALLEQRVDHDSMLTAMVEYVRRVVPAGVIRLVPGSTSDRLLGKSAIHFDVPGPDGKLAGRLFVDVPRDARLEQWHFSYLQAVVQLVSLVKQTRSRPDDPPAAAGAARDLPAGWHRLIVRYRNGRTLKGFSREFTAASSVLEVCPAVEAPVDQRVTVPVAELKAAFFVHDFAGDPARIPTSPPAGGLRGRRITVTFLDGETLVGSTLNYNADAPGFFVQPASERTNNIRVFVASSAIRHVKFR